MTKFVTHKYNLLSDDTSCWNTESTRAICTALGWIQLGRVISMKCHFSNLYHHLIRLSYCRNLPIGQITLSPSEKDFYSSYPFVDYYFSSPFVCFDFASLFHTFTFLYSCFFLFCQRLLPFIVLLNILLLKGTASEIFIRY